MRPGAAFGGTLTANRASAGERTASCGDEGARAASLYRASCRGAGAVQLIFHSEGPLQLFEQVPHDTELIVAGMVQAGQPDSALERLQQ